MNKKSENVIQDFDDMVDTVASINSSKLSLTAFFDDEEEILIPSAGDYHEKLWGGMPAYEAGNTEPVKSLQINFFSWEDYFAFAEVLGTGLTQKTKSLAWPIKDQCVIDSFRWIDENADIE